MKSIRVANAAPFLSPHAQEWDDVAWQEVTLIPTPLAMQPTEYIRKSWQGKAYGEVKTARVASIHDGATWALHARWTGVSPIGRDFPDAIALALPVRGNPALATMGSPEAPIQLLRWQVNKKGARSLLATGIGSSALGPDTRAIASGAADGDVWSVVVSRALGRGKDVAPLSPGKKTDIGFAIWYGSNDERAGIKAFSPEWTELMLEA